MMSHARLPSWLWMFVVAVAFSGCHNPKPAPFDLRGAQEDERTAARDVPMRPVRPLPTTLQSPYLTTTRPSTQPVPPPATGPALDTQTVRRMSLREIVQRTVVNSLDVRVAGYQPAIDQARVVEAEARFDPTLFVNPLFSDQAVLNPSPQNVTLVQPATFRTWSAEAGIRQDLESGGRIEAKYTPQRVHRTQGDLTGFGGTNDVFWTSDFTLQVTQPLLRDFGAEINRARITIARNTQRISLLEFRDQLEKTIGDTERYYWQLQQAERDVAIADQFLGRAMHTAELLFKRIGQDVTRVQLSQANSRVEERRAILIRARARTRDLSDQLKRQMNDPSIPVAGSLLILPESLPLEEQIRFNPEDQIATALENRFELGAQQLRIDSASIANEVGRNNILPQLNLVGSVGVQGAGADYGDAFSDQWDMERFNYSVGLQLEIPIGNRQARAILKRTQLQRLQAIDEYRRLIDQVSLDVKQAMREIETAWEEMYARRQSRFAAEDALAAIEQREAGGEALTYNFVDLKLNSQERLAEAQSAEARAVADYNIAISRLEFAKGTLLRYNNVMMEEAPLVKY